MVTSEGAVRSKRVFIPCGSESAKASAMRGKAGEITALAIMETELAKSSASSCIINNVKTRIALARTMSVVIRSFIGKFHLQNICKTVNCYVNGMAIHFDEQPLGHLLSYTSRLLLTLMHRNFRKSGFEFSHEQWILLLNLWKSDGVGVSQQALGALTGKDKASITRLVQSLEAAGLVSRTVDPHDARIRLVQMTPAGTKLELAMEEVLLETRTQMQKGFDDAELKQLRNLLDRYRLNTEEALGRKAEPHEPINFSSISA